MKALVSGLMLCSVALGSTAALAQQGDHPWQEGQERYDFKHPLRVTCTDFIETAEVYRPFVVAWLSGYSHHLKGIDVVEEGYVPVSVPFVLEECRAHPDRSVSDVVESVGPGHQ